LDKRNQDGCEERISLDWEFCGEEVPFLDALPLWTGDVILTMALDKADKKLQG